MSDVKRRQQMALVGALRLRMRHLLIDCVIVLNFLDARDVSRLGSKLHT